jgi:lysyl-tRNA synthetase class 2
MKVYLRIATELYLKRLIVGGFDRVYEIGKDFRNEGFSRKNSPEFTMIELYQAYADYRDIMVLFEDMISTSVQKVIGSNRVVWGDDEIDFCPPWRRMTIREALIEHAGVDPESATAAELADVARSLSIEVDPAASHGKLVEELVGGVVEPNLVQPTILHDFPIDFPGSLLAKRKADAPDLTERFEVYVARMEIANAFTELNDPRDQRERMLAAAVLLGDEHAEVDWDYITALEYGMPPTGGLGCGIDRLVIVLSGAHHIRETILFPLLRVREGDDVEP